MRAFRGVVVLALCVALAAAAARAATGATIYAALGDSYSSGVGTGSYTLDSTCKRSIYAYPYLWTQKHAGTTLSFVACSGATTSDVLAKQLSAVTGSTTLVSMTIGGNDIGFASLIEQCTLSDCSAALDSTRANLDATLDVPLANVFTAVKHNAPNATVVVLGYPHVFSGASCFGTLGISSTEESKANQLSDALDKVISTQAQQYGVVYRSAIGPFTGHAVCSSSPWLNGLNLFNTTESYHPNKAGHSSGYLAMLTSVTG